MQCTSSLFLFSHRRLVTFVRHRASYISAETKHLATSDACPQLKPDCLRLYSMRWCPFAQRTRLVLAHKQISHEVVNINLTHKPKWITKKNASGTVPFLEILKLDRSHPEYKRQSEIVIGSLQCCEWLELKYPETSRVFNKQEERRDPVLLNLLKEISPLTRSYITQEPLDGIQVTEDHITQSLKKLDEQLDDESKYAAGSQVTMTDFLLWPTFERILAAGYDISTKDLFNLERWLKTMSDLPAVRDVRNSDSDYDKYWKSQKEGNTLYDID